MSAQQERFTGSLVGLAVGDALGAPIEFWPRDALPAVTGMRGGGKFELQPGQWTDDTSLALCIASSIIETESFDLRDQASRFLRWRDKGYLTSTGKCFGIGQQTFWALDDFARSNEIARGESRRWRSGNGSLMRLAPVAMAFFYDLDMTARASAASSLSTHPLVECQESCAAYGRLIAGAIQGWDRLRIFEEGRALASAVSTPAVRRVLEGSYLDKSREEISSSGYVVDTMEAALWAFAQTNAFEDGVLLAVNLGNDADTVGAVYGQLAGAHFGLSNIPAEWVARLHDASMIVDTASRLYGVAPEVRVTEESAAFLPRRTELIRKP